MNNLYLSPILVPVVGPKTKPTKSTATTVVVPTLTTSSPFHFPRLVTTSETFRGIFVVQWIRSVVRMTRYYISDTIIYTHSWLSSSLSYTLRNIGYLKGHLYKSPVIYRPQVFPTDPTPNPIFSLSDNPNP